MSSLSASTAPGVESIQRAYEGAGPDLKHQRLYRALVQVMRTGQLPARSRLPPSRLLARAMHMGRNTVLQVYAQLAAEGLVVAGVGRGTFVSDNAGGPVLKRLSPEATRLESGRGQGYAQALAQSQGPSRRSLLSARGAALLARASVGQRQWGAFMPGTPDVRLFPAATWSRLQSRLWRSVTPPQLSYASGGGDAGLRYAIAQHLAASRGVACSAEQVVITSGTQQSLHLVCQMLTDPGDAMWLEDPGYWGARSVFGAHGLRIVPVQLDAEGLAPTAAQRRDAPRAMFVSPSHQYPLGMPMSAARRLQLLDFAARRGVWVIEDDYDSEFRYSSRPLPALHSQDVQQRVIYLGTFSKTLFPALRLAYVVLPPGLVDAFQSASSELYREGQTPQQSVLARFLSEGHYASHVRRMRGLYRARHDALLQAVARHFGPDWPVHGSGAGLHLVLGLPPGADDADLANRVEQAGVASRPLSLYHWHPAPAGRGLVLGYGAVDEADVARHFSTLAQVVQRHLPARALLR